MNKTSLLAAIATFAISVGATTTLLFLLFIPHNAIEQHFSNPNVKGIKINPADYGPLCDSISTCEGNVSFINCHQEVDGPAFYVDSTNGEVLAACGGYCMGGNCDIEACNSYAEYCKN